MAEQPIAAIGATARKARREVPIVKGTATMQIKPVTQQVNVIQVSALLRTLIARAICSSRVPPVFSGSGGVGVRIRENHRLPCW